MPTHTTTTTTTTYPPPNLPEPLPCPRCDSTNTKFCYYNNYNLSQPRHFCKSCRRYWTHGGSLRNIPIGGSTRKASKPRRSSSSSNTIPTTSTSCLSTSTHEFESIIQAPQIQPTNNNPDSVMPILRNEENCFNLNDKVHLSDQDTSFMSLLSNQQVVVPGFVGFGSSYGLGFCEMGINVWPYNVGVIGSGGDSCGGEGVGVGDTWHMSDEEGCKGGTTTTNNNSNNNNTGMVVDEEECGGYFGCPDLAIATPGTSFK